MDELHLSPFEWRIVGPHGAVLLRKDEGHAKRCASAIRRRAHPNWSRFACGFEVAA